MLEAVLDRKPDATSKAARQAMAKEFDLNFTGDFHGHWPDCLKKLIMAQRLRRGYPRLDQGLLPLGTDRPVTAEGVFPRSSDDLVAIELYGSHEVQELKVVL